MNTLADPETLKSADQELSVASESISFHLNALKETWTSVAQNVFQSDAMKGVIDSFTSLSSIVETFTEKFGLLGATVASGMLVKGLLNIASVAKETKSITKVFSASNFDKLFPTLAKVKNAYTEFGGGLAGLAGSATTLLGALTPLIAVVGAFTVFKLASNYVHRFDNAMQNLNESVTAFDSSNSELDSLNQKLQQNNDAIEEINSHDHITLTDQAELERLREENRELERQRDLQEIINNENKKSAINDARKTTDIQATTDYSIGQSTTNGNVLYEKTDIKTATDHNIAILKGYYSERRKLEDEFNRASNDEEKKAIQNRINLKNDEISKLESHIKEDVSNMKTIADQLSFGDADDIRVADGYYKTIKSLSTVNLNPLQQNISALQSFFEQTPSGNVLREKILEIMKSGGDAKSAIDSMGLSLDAIGLEGSTSISSLNKYFDDLTISAKESASAIEQVEKATVSASDIEAAIKTSDVDESYKSLQTSWKTMEAEFKAGKYGTDQARTLLSYFTGEDIDPNISAKKLKEKYDAVKKKVANWYATDNPNNEDRNNPDVAWGAKQFIKDINATGKANINFNERTATFSEDVKSTEDLAKALDVSVQVIEDNLSNLESFGFNFDNEGFAMAQANLEEFATTLDGLRSAFNSMEDGDQKDKLGELISGFQNDLDSGNISNELVMKINFAYDNLQLQEEIDSIRKQIEEFGESYDKYIAYNDKKQEQLIKQKQANGYKDGDNAGYEAIRSARKNIESKISDTNPDNINLMYQKQISAIYDLQKAYQDVFSGLSNEQKNTFNWEEFLNTDEAKNALQSIQNEYGNALGVLRALYDDMEIEPTVKGLNLDDMLSGFTDTNPVITFDADVSGVKESVTAIQNEDGTVRYVANIDNVETELTPLQTSQGTIFIKADTTEAKGEVEEVTDNDDGSMTFTVTADDQASAIITAIEQMNIMDKSFDISANGNGLTAVKTIDDKGNPKDKSYTITAHYVSVTDSLNGTTHLSGTAHLGGTAYASGSNHSIGVNYDKLPNKWKTKKDDDSVLVGEEDPELVATRDGYWYTVGNNGAEFTSIPKGSVVFDANQTKKLLKNGKINSRGKAYLGGSAQSGTAYKSGSTKSSSKTAEAIDYVARRLEYLANVTKKVADKINNYISSITKTSLLKQQYNAVGKEIEGNQKARDRYQKAADSVKLSSDIKKKIREGSFDITKYKSTKTLDAIKKYQEYYDNVVKCDQAIQELQNTQLQLFEQWANMPTEKAEKSIDSLVKKFNILNSVQQVTQTGGSTLRQLANNQKNVLSNLESAIADAKSKVGNKPVKESVSKAKLNSASQKLTSKDKKTKKNKDGSYDLSKIKKNSAQYKRLANYNKELKAYNDAVKKAESAYNSSLASYNDAQSTYNAITKAYEEIKKTYSINAKYTDGANAYRIANELLDSQYKNKKDQSDLYQKAFEEASKNFVSGQKSLSSKQNSILNNKDIIKQLSSSQKSALENGTEVSEAGLKGNALTQIKAYNQLLAESNILLDAQLTASENASKSLAELAEMRVSNEKQKIENIKSYYDSEISMLQELNNNIEKNIELSSARGKEIYASNYDTELENLKKIREEAKRSYEAISKQFHSAVDSGIIQPATQEWYEMRQEVELAKTQITEFDIELETLDKTIKQIAIDKLNYQLNELKNSADKLNDEMSDINIKGLDVSSDYYKSLIENSKEQVVVLQKQIDLWNKQIDGMDKNSEAYQDLIGNINDAESAIRDAYASQREWNNTIINMPITQLEKALEYVKSIAGFNSSINDLIKASGYDLSISDYEKSISDLNDEIDNMVYRRTKVLENYKESLSNGEYGGKSSDDWEKEYKDLGAEINNTRIELESLKDEMRQDIEFRGFERMSDHLSRLRTQLEIINAQIDDKDKYDDEGRLTSQGYTAIAVAQQERKTYLKDIEIANAKIEKINSMRGKNGYSEAEYLQDIANAENELLSALQNEMSARETIRSLVEESTNMELDAINKIIDKWEEALDTQKEVYDYGRNIRSQTREVSNYEKQLIALQGDTSEENRARLQSLQESYNDARDDLYETQFSHYISEQKKLVSELTDQWQENSAKYVDDIIDNMRDITDLLETSIGLEDNVVTDRIVNTDSDNLTDTGKIEGSIITMSENLGNKIDGIADTIKLYDVIHGDIPSLYDMSLSPSELYKAISIGSSSGNVNNATSTITIGDIQITLEGVQNPEEFANAFENEFYRIIATRRGERAIQSVSTDRLNGGSTISKFKS